MASAATKRQVHAFNLLRQIRILQNAGAKSVSNQLKDLENQRLRCKPMCFDLG